MGIDNAASPTQLMFDSLQNRARILALGRLAGASEGFQL
jgi:hypothetical protein